MAFLARASDSESSHAQTIPRTAPGSPGPQLQRKFSGRDLQKKVSGELAFCNNAGEISRQLARISSIDLAADNPSANAAAHARAHGGAEIKAQVERAMNAMKGLKGQFAKDRERRKRPRPQGYTLMRDYRTKSGGFATQWNEHFGVVVHAPVAWPSATKSSPEDPYLDDCGACHHTHSMLSDTARQRIFGFRSPCVRACCGSVHVPITCACDLAVGVVCYGATAFWCCAAPPGTSHKYWRLSTAEEREEWDAERLQRVVRKRQHNKGDEGVVGDKVLAQPSPVIG